MAVEIDDLSVRIIGNNYRGLQFYDNDRTLRQEIFLTDGNILNIGDAPAGGSSSGPSDGGGVAIGVAAGRGIKVSGSGSYIVSLNEDIDADWTSEHVFEQIATFDLGIDIGEDQHIGIGAAAERIVFDGTAGEIELLGANVLVNTQTAVGGKVEILSTGEQLRLEYDAAHYASFTVGNGGNLVLTPTGNMVFNPTGNNILPYTSYDLNIGSLTKKYLTLHAAELWVETLVAQETVATIGGRVLVGPTTEVTRDLAAGGATIYVKHNQMQSGDRVYLEANGSVEFLSIDSGPTAEGAGDYSYDITRNLDGTGANAWSAGDAVLNTGQAGNGWIDMYSNWSMSARRIEYIYNYENTGPVFSANLAASKNYDLFGTPDSTFDSVYFGVANEAWENIHLNLSVAADYDATITWTYWNGAAWTVFTPDTTTDFKSTGIISVTWAAGDLAGWAQVAVNGVTAYWIRAFITAFTSWTTDPKQAGREIRRGTNQWGPTLVGNVRQSATFNDWEPRWAIGNLNSLYGVGGDYYGIGLGDYSTGNYLRYDEDGGFIMSAGDGNTTIDADGIRLYSAAAGAAGRRVDMMYVDSGTTYTIGTVYGAYDGGDPNDEAFMWLVAYHGGGDPWTHPRITLSAYDSDAGEEAWIDVRTTDFEHVNIGPELTVANAVYIGAETQASAIGDLTKGLVINQGTATDALIVGKGSTIGHGMTTIVETDTYCTLGQDAANYGGVLIRGLTESVVGVEAIAYVTSVSTNKTTAASGAVQLGARLKNGTGLQDMSADANLVVIKNRNTTRFIFDAEGSAHADVEWTTFEGHDDVMLIEALETELKEWKGDKPHAVGHAEGRKMLEDAKLVTFDEDEEGKPHAMVNTTRLMMLLAGAIRQVDAKARQM